MESATRRLSRRGFLGGAMAAAGLAIVPRNVLGGPGQDPPSETLGGALIGCGGRGGGTFRAMSTMGLSRGQKPPVTIKQLAICDVKFLDRADNKRVYTDFRRVIERKDIDVVAIATPPHWHALISIAAAQAGKDVFCEKPMTRFIAEGRAVVNAIKRYGRVFQVGTWRRFGACRSANNILIHKLMVSGLLKNVDVVYRRRGGFKVKMWSGKVNLQPQPVPKNLDWDLYCGPSPLRPYNKHRTGGTHRGYWDYEGGGLADMGQHHLDAFQWIYGKDHTSPVEVEAYAPPAHPEACGMWGWVELRYADGLTLVLESGEWGKPYDRKPSKGLDMSKIPDDILKKVKEMPDPTPMVSFAEAVKTRKQGDPNGPEAAHRCATLLHLSNIAIRTGRKIRYDPVKEQIIGDEEANRLAYQPMRAPWHL